MNCQGSAPRSPGKPFLILSIDGGGLRGAYAAHVLMRIERTYGVRWRDQFDMFAGTSTGSILAAGLACGMKAEKLAGFYKTHGPDIFQPKAKAHLDPKKLFTSRYKKTTLERLLKGEFGEMTLGDVPVPLILPAVDIGNGCVHVFKSKYDDFVRDQHVPVAEAVLSSCSAPTYFDPHFLDNTYQLADGGLWANNPALVATIDAHYRCSVPLEDIRVLSIGTGKSNTFYSGNPADKAWGMLTGWEGPRLIELILNLQSDAAHNMLCLLLGESPKAGKNVCRLTFESDQPLPMDQVAKLSDWVTRADASFTHHADQIAALLASRST